ncbi:hypothetical protein GCM10028773_31490 [Spirosoma koreense]
MCCKSRSGPPPGGIGWSCPKNYIMKQQIVSRPVRKVYHSPQVRKLGQVAQLTLKIGSVSDGLSLHVG